MLYWDDHVLKDDSPPSGYFGDGRCMKCGEEINHRPRHEDDARYCVDCGDGLETEHSHPDGSPRVLPEEEGRHAGSW